MHAMSPQRLDTRSGRAELALTGVYEVSKVLSTPARLESRLASVLALLSSFLDMNHGLIAVLGPEGEPELVVGSGWSEANAKAYFERLPEQAIGRIVATKMPLVVQDAHADPLFAGMDLAGWGGEGEGTFAMIGVPIKEGDRVVGALTVDCDAGPKKGGGFDHDVRFLTMIANLVGQTLQLQRVLVRDRDRLMADQRRREKALSTDDALRSKGAEGIVGESAAVQAVIEKVRTVAKSQSTVLLRGESGTGKEMFASAIHNMSPRRNGPFIKLNCAALPESVLESELFGHEKGAFTGAVNQRKGRFELADRGTLFLDEIGEISAAFQAKLLRVLQEGEFERVGGTKSLKVDVRLICATNRDLEAAVQKGEFRADLYYRICVVPIFLPPLREREGDVPLLAREFLERFNAEHGTELTLSDEAYAVLSSCYFPGNVRELENCVWRTATLARGERLVATDFACSHGECLSSILWRGVEARERPLHQAAASAPLPLTPLPVIRKPAMPASAAPAPAGAAASPHACPAPGACPVPGADMRSDREKLTEAMETAGWVQAKAARLLGLTPRQVGYALRKHGVEIKKF